jgi:pimeloyl-ACP methyl ester carboxylesterase
MLLSLLAGTGFVVSGAVAASGLIGADAEQAHPPAGRFVDLPGGRMHLVEAGSLSPSRASVVLLHGATSHHADLFDVLGPRLSGMAHVVAVDRPGHGWSDRLGGREMADPGRQAAAVMAALDGVGVGTVVLVAHSLAGAMAARMALDHPERVVGLVLLGAVTHPWPGAKITWYYHPSAWPVFGPAFIRSVVTPVGALVLEPSIAGVFAPQAPPADYARRAQIKLALRPASFAANALDVRVMYGYVTRQAPLYSALRMPVVAIAGDADTVVWTHIHSHGMAREAPRGRLIELPGVGHMPHHAAPDLIAREALALC